MPFRFRRAFLPAAAALAALGLAACASALGGGDPAKDPIAYQRSAAVGAGGGHLECDGHPYPACSGWRSGGTAGGWGGHFDADRGLKTGCAAWHVEHAAELTSLGLASWNQYAAKYGKPNDGTCNLDLASAPAALAAETAPAGTTVLPGPGVPSVPPAALGVTGRAGF